MSSTSSVSIPSDKKYLHGNLVRYLIREGNLRQKDVARRLRVSDAALARYLSNDLAISSESLAALSAILNIEPQILLLDEVPQ